jgi:hypothetical protein
MRAIVGVQEQEDGSMLAKAVRAGTPRQASRQRYAGQIVSVDTAASTFTLKPRRGDQDLVFVVDENTRFRGKDGSVESLDDLEPEMVAVVVAKEQEDGTLLALGVGAAKRDQLPQFEAKVRGRVLSVGNNSFTMQTRSGEVSILVTGSTAFRARGGQVGGLEDLQEGMIVAVGGKDLGNGMHQYQADLVLVLRRGR